MKKFISIVTVLIISLSVTNCRDAEELSAIPENKIEHSIATKVVKDSTHYNKDSDSTNIANNTNDEGEPKKDKINW